MASPFSVDASGFSGTAERRVAPRDEAELSETLAEASRQGIPVTAAGAGTGVTGSGVAQGGWIVSLEKFRRLDIAPGHAVAGAGVSLADLQAAAARTGQFYAPDPTERTATIGGSIATNGSGSRSFRYGATRRHVLALQVFLADGRAMRVRRGEPIDFDVPLLPAPRTTKHAAGYPLAPAMDWVDLFVGAEGTLGIVAEAELRLLPAPARLLTGVVFFSSSASAVGAAEAWRPIGGLRMIEYLDANSLALVRSAYPDIPVPARAALLIEQEDGDPDLWADRLEAARAMADESWFAASAEDRERFRRFRHALAETVNDTVRRRGFLKHNTDFAVPVDRNREMMAFYERRLEAELSGRYVIFGHIGDAHLHVNVLPESVADTETATRVLFEFAQKAVALGGTVSAEHGLGKRKAHLLALQFTPAQIEAMKAVKRRLDPQWLLGRGTLFA